MVVRTKKKKSSAPSMPRSLARQLVEHPLNTVIDDNLKTYGPYIVEERAIPSLQDGLKPSQRRTLWALYHTFKNHPNKGYLKAMKVEGATAGFHPHSGTYGVQVNMIEGTTCPLLTGMGNFGSFSAMYTPPAAPRYTEVKLSHFTMEALFDKRFEKVYPLVPSYDGQDVEPIWLPAQLPLILAMASTGIALGVMSSIPSFSVPSLLKVVRYLFKNKKKPNAKFLAKHLEVSSPYGGRLLSTPAEVETLIATGRGPLRWECSYHIDNKKLHITGLPPGWSYDNKIEVLRNLPGVSAVEDMSSDSGINIRVTFQRLNEEAWEDAVSAVRKHLQSSITYRCNVTTRHKVEDELVATSSATFASMSIVEILEQWMRFRVQIEKEALRVEHEELKRLIAYQELLKLAVDNIDVIFALLKKKGIDKVKELAKKLKITEEQSKTIWAIQVGRLDRLSEQEIVEKIKSLTLRKKEVQRLFKNPEESITLHMNSCQHLGNPVAYEQ